MGVYPSISILNEEGCLAVPPALPLAVAASSGHFMQEKGISPIVVGLVIGSLNHAPHAQANEQA